MMNEEEDGMMNNLEDGEDGMISYKKRKQIKEETGQ